MANCICCNDTGFYCSLYDGWEQRCDCNAGQKSSYKSEWEKVHTITAEDKKVKRGGWLLGSD